MASYRQRREGWVDAQASLASDGLADLMESWNQSKKERHERKLREQAYWRAHWTAPYFEVAALILVTLVILGSCMGN